MSESTHSRQPVQYRGVVDGRLLEVELQHRIALPPKARLRIDGELIPQHERSTTEGDSSPTGPYWTMEHGEVRQLHVHRPREDGDESHRVHERIEVRSRSLGRAGEVDVRLSQWGTRTALLPEDGSRSAQRDDAQRAHPYRRAVLRGISSSLKIVVPLLGIGELIDRLTQPAQDAAEEAVRPTATWLTQLLEPVGRILGAIGDALGHLFSWLGPLLNVLFGWIPPLLDWLPSWGIGPALSVVIILVNALTAYRQGRRRVARLDAQEKELGEHLRRRIVLGVREVIARGEADRARPVTVGGATPEPALSPVPSPPADHPRPPRRSAL